MAFFKKHLEFLSVRSRSGSPFLLKTLCWELGNSIRRCLPKLRTDLDRQICRIEERLRSLGHEGGLDELSDLTLFIKLLGNFKSKVCSSSFCGQVTRRAHTVPNWRS